MNAKRLRKIALYLEYIAFVLKEEAKNCDRRADKKGKRSSRSSTKRKQRMSRTLTSHKVNGLNEVLRIEVFDEPGAGGASHVYGITSDEPRNSENPPAVTLPIRFQDGPIAEAGVNGISQEALLAIVEDRLKSFQAGPYACRENAIALTHVQDAMHWLHHRTRERVARGVEGTSKV